MPIIASEHEYLLHSMLALAASDLMSSAHDTSAPPPNLMSTAIAHRVKAINSLNQALSTTTLSFAQGNAMIGTCYALVFQSTLMDDGLSEYMTFIRGIVLVSIQLAVRNLRFMFENMLDNDSLAAAEPMLEKAPELDNEPARAASYMNLRKVYGYFSYAMCNADFQSLLNPSNVVGKLLQAHFVAIQLLMSDIFKEENAKNPSTENYTARWIGPVCRDVPEEMMGYFEWPLSVANSFKKEICDRNQSSNSN
ncbi:hypothetical protein BP6252_05615 [Coleophoma cylindrospora]|uniref:Transcription factor domain-containing protein n=1 Tax=Coleophoma cylindrospora TaxID=1849047 RepID=A0A3D8RTY7_9HELO|nr:hypothetical protein BP6252_05615 [Coleophoma cylindrospora]